MLLSQITVKRILGPKLCVSWKHTALLDCIRGWQVGWAGGVLNTEIEGKVPACSVLSTYGRSCCGVSRGWSGTRSWLRAQN